MQINLELSVTFDTVTKTSQLPKTIGPPTPNPSEVAKDLEDAFLEPKHSDFTVIAGDKKFSVHKVIIMVACVTLNISRLFWQLGPRTSRQCWSLIQKNMRPALLISKLWMLML